ncbi:MAG: hypothetical protein KAI66_20035 [Lentisphaeria bacterium]|nr:hypothetical protein [Lentisphaeria bacterium]
MMNRLHWLKWIREKGIAEASLSRHRIIDYEPCHVRYQFGHYPTRTPYEPTEEDWNLLEQYAQWGGGIVHLWYWNEWCGVFGKGVFDAINPQGLKRFLDEAHRRGLKVISYVSPGYMDVSNIDHRSEWSRGSGHLVELSCDFDRLCPGSPGWRRYFLLGIEKLLDQYGFDGVYWDGGIGPGMPGCANAEHDGHVHFVEADPSALPSGEQERQVVDEGFFALWNDLLCEMHAMVKQRGGVTVAHIGGDHPPPFEDRCWDYLLLGEGIPDVLASVEKTKEYPPYVLRFNDWSKLITNWRKKDLTPDLGRVAEIEHLSMAAAIPYLQFPWLEDGCYGQVESMFDIPGTSWKQGYDHWTEWMKAQGKAGLAPLGNASWAAGRERYGEYLQLYRRLTAPGNVAYVEVGDCQGLPFPTTRGRRRVSLFAGDSLWVAIGNLEDRPETVAVSSLDNRCEARQVELPAGRLTLLRYRSLDELPEVT